MKRLLKSSSGFTLIEVMVALAITSISFSAIFSMAMQGVRIVRYTEEESKSAQAIQYELEKIRTFSWDTITGLSSPYTVTELDNFALGALNDCVATVTVTPYPNAGDATEDVRAISVSVSWTQCDGLTGTNSLVTLVAARGMKE